MYRVVDCIVEQHDLRLVALAAFLCVLACWSGVTLASRARVSVGRLRLLWICAAGTVFGTGVWATHFVAMLAYQSGVQIGYDLYWTVASILVADVISIAGFAVVLRPGLAPHGGVLLGIAVSAMHFTGMRAVEGPFVLSWSLDYVVASLLLSVSIAALAAIVGVTIRNIWGRAGAAALLALAIISLHFTAMAAVVLVPNPHVAYDSTVLAPASLAMAVAAAALLIVVLGLIAALLDNHLAHRRIDEAERLRAHIAQLEATQRSLQQTSRDLTDALAKAAAASEAKSAFLAAMSHELRTPLNAVIGFSDLILSETFGPLGNAHYRDYLADINRSGVHLLELVNTVLDLSRLDAGEMLLNEEAGSLRAVLEDALRAIAAQAEKAQLNVIVEAADGMPGVRMDPKRMRQVLTGILSNAVKFTPPPGCIRVTLDCPDGPRIVISDTGIGIAEADIPRAFERFGQVDSRLSRKFEGTGLGLPLAKQLVELHGGTLALESQAGAGTKVTICLPATRLAAMPASAPPPARLAPAA
ncbi:MAG TPA: ATP-binding protein [Rhizomicrobium sp.]|nr:ATP-binding protein [Rhizomicrobium sp.]